MKGNFKLREINYDIKLTDNRSEVRTVSNYKVEKINDNTVKILIYSNISGKEFLYLINKISRYLLTIGIIVAKDLQNFEDELLDIWMFKNFGYTE